MDDPRVDRIHVRDLLLRCILGVEEAERREKQDVNIQITLHAELRRACGSDAIADTVDYKTVKQRVIRMVEQSSFFLVERLAQRIAEVCLDNAAVKRVDVCVEKPGALRFARTVAVEITRTQEAPGA